ncbi:MAG: hypothetical protein ACMVO3_08365 [Thalassobaculum sp.]
MTSVSSELDQLDEPVSAPPRTRSCLRCRSDFQSEWAGERICKRCKGTSAWREGIPGTSHAG